MQRIVGIDPSAVIRNKIGKSAFGEKARLGQDTAVVKDIQGVSARHVQPRFERENENAFPVPAFAVFIFKTAVFQRSFHDVVIRRVFG